MKIRPAIKQNNIRFEIIYSYGPVESSFKTLYILKATKFNYLNDITHLGNVIITVTRAFIIIVG